MSAFAVGTRVWFPGHVPALACWCRPRLVESWEHGQVWLHRQVIVRPDNQIRCFQSVLNGPPVP